MQISLNTVNQSISQNETEHIDISVNCINELLNDSEAIKQTLKNLAPSEYIEKLREKIAKENIEEKVKLKIKEKEDLEKQILEEQFKSNIV